MNPHRFPILILALPLVLAACAHGSSQGEMEEGSAPGLAKEARVAADSAAENVPKDIRSAVPVSGPSTPTPAPVPNLSLRIRRSVFKTATEAFVPHRGERDFSNYLAMAIPYDPVKDVFSQLERQLGRALVTRGEAHITVITPVEYDEILKPYLSIGDIEAIAKKIGLQPARFAISCLGRAQALVEGAYEQSYYVVVRSETLTKIRDAVFKAYVERGGERSRFDPLAFYPHITVGFTKTDLHESNGVKKGVNSCISPLPAN